MPSRAARPARPTSRPSRLAEPSKRWPAAMPWNEGVTIRRPASMSATMCTSARPQGSTASIHTVCQIPVVRV